MVKKSFSFCGFFCFLEGCFAFLFGGGEGGREGWGVRGRDVGGEGRKGGKGGGEGGGVGGGGVGGEGRRGGGGGWTKVGLRNGSGRKRGRREEGRRRGGKGNRRGEFRIESVLFKRGRGSCSKRS